MNDQKIFALTDEHVAERLSLKVSTLRAWRVHGKGPKFVRFGRAVRYLVSDLEEFVKASASDVGDRKRASRQTCGRRRTEP